jgi:branched-chain amino acid transport system ATP-binding protein
LQERVNQKAGTMSGGEQQMLAIGRALMAKPTLLLLDEPSMGLAPLMVEAIFGVIKEINSQGITVLLVEQNALMALAVAHRGYVIQTGRIVLADTADALRQNEMVRKAYLGEE